MSSVHNEETFFCVGSLFKEHPKSKGRKQGQAEGAVQQLVY